MSSLMRTGGAFVVLCVGASVCLGQTTQPAGEVIPDAAATATTQPVNAVLATVNGHEIRESDFENMFQQMMSNRFRGQPVPEAQITRMRDQFRPRLLGTLVEYQLLNEEAKQSEVSVTDEEVNSRLEREVQDTILLRGVTRDELNQQVQSQMGISLDEAMAERKVDPFYRDMVLHMKLLQQKYPEETKVTDEEIQEAYESMKSRFEKPEQVRASHILINTTELKTDEEKAEARAKLAGILEKVKAGEDFGALAEEHSDCPSGKRAKGDLGFFPRQGAMVEPFAEAAFGLKVGDVSDIVETNFGYHIIKLTERREAHTTTLEEAKQALIDQTLSRKVGQVREKLLTELKEKGTINYAEGMEPPAPPKIVPTTQPVAPPPSKVNAPPIPEPEKPTAPAAAPPAKPTE